MKNEMNENNINLGKLREQNYDVLSKERELELFKRYHIGDDQDAYVEIIYSNLNFVREYITQLCENNEELEDFIQEGYLTLVNAIESYDYTKDDYFYYYLIKCINCEILQSTREDIISNNELVFEQDEFITNLTQREAVQRCFSLLSPREIEILCLHHGLEDGNSKTFKEIGEMFKITGERARVIEKTAFRKIKDAIGRVHYENESLLEIDQEGIPYQALGKMQKKKKKTRRKRDVMIWGKM